MLLCTESKEVGVEMESPPGKEAVETVEMTTKDRRHAIPWTAAYQSPPSMEFSRQEYWSGLPVSFSRGSSRPGE